MARVKVDGGKYDSLKCSRCRTVVPPADIEATPFPTVRQSTAGVRARARRRRFDYANWDEV